MLSALQNFDLLPGSAHVRLPVVAALCGCSNATVWRMVKLGALPAPKHLSARAASWQVGQLRAALSGDAP